MFNKTGLQIVAPERVDAFWTHVLYVVFYNTLDATDPAVQITALYLAYVSMRSEKVISRGPGKILQPASLAYQQLRMIDGLSSPSYPEPPRCSGHVSTSAIKIIELLTKSHLQTMPVSGRSSAD